VGACVDKHLISSHQIQYQHGKSIPEFLHDFGTETQCAEVLRRVRWPHGFRCPRCSITQRNLAVQGARKLYQGGSYSLQASLTTGTMIEYT
jgi:hypothetical protein